MTEEHWLELNSAVEVIKNHLHLPTGAAVMKLVEACASGIVRARELNPEPGEDWWPLSIPAAHWKDPDAHIDLGTGLVVLAGETYGKRTVFTPAGCDASGMEVLHASMPRVEVSGNDLNHYLQEWVGWPIEPESGKRVRTRPKRGPAQDAIAALWPDGVPSQSKLPNKKLCAHVKDWLGAHDHPSSISDDTILRAAGRKATKALP
jgi:hypothetical protein